MKTPYCLFVIVLAASLLSTRGEEKKLFYVQDGDRVVFYGDSITDQRLYTTDIESFIVTRFPKKNVTFVHSGWGGDRVTGGGGGPIDLRLHRDVIAYKPTVMTIMLGMNDGSYRAFDPDIFKTYTNGYAHIIDVVKKELPGLRLTLIVPSPFDDVTREPKFPGGYNSVLVQYGDYVRSLAGQENATVADLNAPVVAALQKAKEVDAKLSVKLIADRVHPGPAGHLLMAEALLKSWGAPSTVSKASLDAADKKMVQAVGCSIKHLKTTPLLSWDQLDDSLPMPLYPRDDAMALALKASDFLETLDQEIVKVVNLSAANYELRIDTQPVGTYSKDELATGVNLATAKTPMQAQAVEVHKLTLLHNDIHFNRWRQVQVNQTYQELPNLPEVMNDLDGVEKSVVAAQRKRAKPVVHHFELVPANN